MSNSKLKAAILIISQTASQDPSTDKCIPILEDTFSDLGNGQWDVAISEIVPDSVLEIQKFIRTHTDSENPVNLIITSGGTGFAVKDVTPEVWRC
jgi:gephyrin